MIEFGGPFRWVSAAVVEAEAEPDVISPEAAPQLWAKPTDNPGFVTLHWARTSRCSHEAPLAALPADSFRRLMLDFCRARFPANYKITPTGPAVNCAVSNCVQLYSWW